MADPQQPLQGESVERIREIIFGPKMRDYEQRFEAVTRDLGRLQQELDHLNEQLTAKDAAQGKNLQGMRQELRQTGSDLRKELKAEITRAGAQLTEQTAAQATNLQTLRQELHQADDDLHAQAKADLEELATQMAEQDAAQKTNLGDLRQELRKADADLREELRQIAQRLTDGKTDRSTLGELFIELGGHLKTGGSLADLLQNLELPS
jgi:chromosome segregation ATPase